jgi:ribulose bisphosphate carboxylase small subunit
MSIPRVKRRYTRALCSELVRISFRDQRGRRVQETAVLEDLGEQGARISLCLPLTPGCQVGFQAVSFEASAQVRYCELSDSGFAVGIEFADDFRWDEKDWAPEHLLRLPNPEFSDT